MIAVVSRLTKTKSGLTLAWIITILMTLTGCNVTEKPAPKKHVEIKEQQEIRPFDINLEIVPLGDKIYDLSIQLVLDTGQYVYSSHSQDSLYMHFTVSLDSNSFLMTKEEIVEIPPSIVEFDTIIHQPVHYIRQNTLFKQKISVLTSQNFDTTGLIEFLIEPSCIPYQVTFAVAQEAWGLTVRKTGTRYHPSYKAR